MSQRLALILAAVMGLTAVAAGAFGAHALQDRVATDLLETFEIAARYHMYHALALLGTAVVVPRLGRAGAAAGWCFVIGTLIFSGTLYALALTGQRWLGAITPIGGLILIVGWACIAGATACAIRG